MKIVCLYSLLFLLTLSSRSWANTPLVNTIKPFQSDNCSVWPDKILKWDYAHCCIEHDYYYWMGGTQKQRLKADREFRSCVSKESFKLNANVMYLAVRFMGYLSHVKPFRWGYGWEYERKDHDLNEAEMIEVLRHTPESLYAAAVPTWTKEEKEKNKVSYKPAPYPSVTGNYCLDEVVEKLDLSKLNTDFLKIEFSEPTGTNNTYVIRTNLCGGDIIAHFSVPSLKFCTEPRYDETPSKYLNMIHGRASCEKTILKD